MKYRVLWLIIFALCAVAVYVPGMWYVAIFGFIGAFFIGGMKPIERRKAPRGCAVTWILLTLALAGAAVVGIMALRGGV